MQTLAKTWSAQRYRNLKGHGMSGQYQFQQEDSESGVLGDSAVPEVGKEEAGRSLLSQTVNSLLVATVHSSYLLL